jgi:hypothetical protein
MVDESINRGGRNDVIAQGLSPANWNWHTFIWDQMLSELLILGLGVSAGFRGVSAVC